MQPQLVLHCTVQTRVIDFDRIQPYERVVGPIERFGMYADLRRGRPERFVRPALFYEKSPDQKKTPRPVDSRF